MNNTPKTVCKVDMCTGCMACVQKCPRDAISINDSILSFNAVIDEAKCINCNQCYNVCQINHPVDLTEPISWSQGYANDQELRKNAASGGAASAISKAFIGNGGAVCSCAFFDGDFGFKIAETTQDLKQFAGSKYVKSNPKDIYKKIDELLKNKKVLFIALPCQVAALKKYIKDKQNLYTIDLICHGTPSQKLLKGYLSQHKLNLSTLENISFRRKNQFGLYESGDAFLNGACDSYTLSFLSALNYTENCYFCNYARLERVSDITLGDSWGTEIDKSEQEKGISLIMCQTEKGKELISLADLYLTDVNRERAIKYNRQLNEPSQKHPKRDKLIVGFKEGKSYDWLICGILTKSFFKQKIKSLLIRLHLI